MPSEPAPAAISPLLEQEFLPLARAYVYLRLAGITPAAAAPAIARLQTALAATPGRVPGEWWRLLVADPVWSERRRVVVAPSPPLSRHWEHDHGGDR